MNADERRFRVVVALVTLTVATRVTFAEEPADTLQRAAEALSKGDVTAFAAGFDPKMPGLAKIRGDATELVRQADVQSTIQVRDGGSADWELVIAGKQNSHSITHRQARVTYRVAQGRIEAFGPTDFFRPPRVDGAWNVLESAATALSNGNLTEFMSCFEKSMPGYDRLEAGAAALVSQGDVHSSIDMQSNEGSDTSRTIEVDWTLSVVNADTSIRHEAREHRVKYRVELKGKRWRITAVDPPDFFRAFLLGMDFPHKGETRALLLNGHLKCDSAVRRNTLHWCTDGAQPGAVRIG